MNFAMRKRIQSTDLLRGLVMAIIGLDHCRDFLHYNANSGQDPPDLSAATRVLCFTRSITHCCAPVFVPLTGTGTFLYFQNAIQKKQVFIFLSARGL
jgi:uncharacterized membrane protein